MFVWARWFLGCTGFHRQRCLNRNEFPVVADDEDSGRISGRKPLKSESVCSAECSHDRVHYHRHAPLELIVAAAKQFFGIHPKHSALYRFRLPISFGVGWSSPASYQQLWNRSNIHISYPSFSSATHHQLHSQDGQPIRFKLPRSWFNPMARPSNAGGVRSPPDLP